MAKPQADGLDHTIAFLAKREGIDKTLKIIRYASRLVVALSPPDSERRARFDALQSSVGTSRKAYRLGKFLQDVNAARRVRLAGNPSAVLELAAALGEGTYYFLDQFLWLMKTGFLQKRHERAIVRASAAAELLGYAASVSLGLARLRALDAQAAVLRARAAAAAAAGVPEPGLARQLELMSSARLLRLALIAQDLADSCNAINDLSDGRLAGFNQPVLLACAGLLSAAISSYKYWNA